MMSEYEVRYISFMWIEIEVKAETIVIVILDILKPSAKSENSHIDAVCMGSYQAKLAKAGDMLSYR